MEILVAFIISFLLLVYCVLKGIFVAYPLAISFLIFVFIAVKRGNKINKVISLAFEGGRKSLSILKVFILIGGITAIWMSSGTVAAIVFYGIEFLKPEIFIVCAFLICSFVSFLIGTSFGTVGTVGIALMVIARGGGVSVSAAAGAIIAGAYFGDRCSPMSSSANLVASITKTNLYDNIKNMYKTSIIPFLLTLIIYFVISLRFPLNNSGNYLNNEILKVFNIGPVVLIPAIIMLLFSIIKIEVKISMAISILTAIFISISIQHYSIIQCINYIIFGYNMPVESTLTSIIKGGGIISMLKTALVVLISSAFSGIFEGTGLLNSVQQIINQSQNRYHVFRNTAITSIITSMFGCSQSLAVIMTEMLNKKSYVKNNISKEQSAVDLENTAIVIAPLIPWNVALLVPMINLRADFKCIPFLLYLYLIPVFNLLYLKIKMARNN